MGSWDELVPQLSSGQNYYGKNPRSVLGLEKQSCLSLAPQRFPGAEAKLKTIQRFTLDVHDTAPMTRGHSTLRHWSSEVKVSIVSPPEHRWKRVLLMGTSGAKQCGRSCWRKGRLREAKFNIHAKEWNSNVCVYNRTEKTKTSPTQ